MPGRLYEATAGRLWAAVYDRAMAVAERAGLEDRRARLLAGARGVTLELGAGTGINLAHYPEAVTELVLSEPGPHMARRLQARVAASAHQAQIVVAPGEELPFADDHFDTIVGTLILCTARDPAAVLAEVTRVLRPGGQLLFIEHVRSENPKLARWQDRLAPAWRYAADGCHCNRDTLGTLAASDLDLERVDHGRLPRTPPIVRPLIAGVARVGP